MDWTKSCSLCAESEIFQPHGVELNEEEKSTREEILKEAWVSHIKDEFDLPEAAFGTIFGVVLLFDFLRKRCF